MKGQFMLVSAVVVSLTVMTVASVISDIQSQEYEIEDSSSQIIYIQEEGKQLTSGAPPTSLDRENYRKLLGYTDYRTEMTYSNMGNCFNVTMVRPNERIDLNCLS